MQEVKQKPSFNDCKRILMIRALVNFNLIPPRDSAAWKAHADRYEDIGEHLVRVSHFTNQNVKVLMTLLGQSGKAATPPEKLELYNQLFELTGFSPDELTCEIVQKYRTLAGKCSYAKFISPDCQSQINDDSYNLIIQWHYFNTNLPEYYLWDADKIQDHMRTQNLISLFLLEFLKNNSDETMSSCLLALAKIMHQHEIQQLLENMGMTDEAIPEPLRQFYLEYNNSTLVTQESGDETLSSDEEQLETSALTI